MKTEPCHEGVPPSSKGCRTAPLSSHDLRHFMATEMLHAGVPIKAAVRDRHPACSADRGMFATAMDIVPNQRRQPTRRWREIDPVLRERFRIYEATASEVVASSISVHTRSAQRRMTRARISGSSSSPTVTQSPGCGSKVASFARGPWLIQVSTTRSAPTLLASKNRSYRLR